MNPLWILAEIVAQAQPAPAAGQAAPNPFTTMAPLMIVFFVFYFLVIRPQAKKQKQHDAMIQELKKGDRVLTTGGLYGRIFSVKDDLVVLVVAENVKVEVLKSAVTRVVE